jgi:hypothetical protein
VGNVSVANGRAPAARCPERAGEHEPEREPGCRNQPRLTASEVLDVPEQLVRFDLVQVSRRALALLGRTLGHSRVLVVPLAARLIRHLSHPL